MSYYGVPVIVRHVMCCLRRYDVKSWNDKTPPCTNPVLRYPDKFSSQKKKNNAKFQIQNVNIWVCSNSAAVNYFPL